MRMPVLVRLAVAVSLVQPLSTVCAVGVEVGNDRAGNLAVESLGALNGLLGHFGKLVIPSLPFWVQFQVSLGRHVKASAGIDLRDSEDAPAVVNAAFVE